MRSIFQPRYFVYFSISLLLLAALFIQTGAYAQPTQALNEDWRDSDYGFISQMMDNDQNGNIYVVGDTSAGDYLVIKKFSPSGTLVWQNTYNPQARLRGVWITVDQNNDPIVLATIITGGNGDPAGWLTIKYDTNGVFQWANDLPGSYADARRAEVDGNNDIYVAGRRFLPNSFGNTTHDSVLIKYNPTGDTLWTASFDNNSAVDEPFALTISADGSRIGVAGKSGNLYMALMYDPDGNLLWSDANLEAYPANDISFGPGNISYFATGTYFPQDPVTYQMAIVKYDAAGARSWIQSYNVGYRTLRLGVDSQGNVLATGIVVPGYMDWMTIKTDADGNLLWSQRYDGGRNNDEIPNMLLIDGSDAVYVTGKGGPNPSTGNISYLKGIIAKYNSDGTPQWAVFDDYAGGKAIRLGAFDTLASIGFGYLVTTGYTQTGLPDTVPAAPTNLNGLLVFDGFNYRVNLYFTDNANNEFWVEAERCTGAGCTDFTYVAQTLGENASGTADQNVVYGATYTYRLRARGFMGLSAPSNTIEVTILPGTPPAAPSNLTAGMNATNVELSWQDNSADESQFYIERCQGEGCVDFTGAGVVGADITSWLDANTYPGLSYSYRIRAWNSNGFSDYSNIATILTPGTPNSAPVLDFIGDRTVDELTTLTFTASASDVDVPPQALAFSLGLGAPSGASIDPVSGVFSWTPSEAQGPGVYPVKVIVTDDGLPPLSDDEIFNITVNEVPPVIQVNAGSDQSTNEGQVVQFSGGYTESLGLGQSPNVVVIHWDFGDGTSATGSLTPTHSYGDNGIYAVTLTVTDTVGAVGQDSLTVTAANTAPILDSISDQPAKAGQVITIPVSFSDPGWLDSHEVTVEWAAGASETINLPPGVTDVVLQHTYSSTGDYPVTVTVTDQDGAYDSHTFTIMVETYLMFLPHINR